MLQRSISVTALTGAYGNGQTGTVFGSGHGGALMGYTFRKLKNSLAVWVLKLRW